MGLEGVNISQARVQEKGSHFRQRERCVETLGVIKEHYVYLKPHKDMTGAQNAYVGGKEGSPRKQVKKGRHHQVTESLDTIWAFGSNLGMTNHPRILDRGVT